MQKYIFKDGGDATGENSFNSYVDQLIASQQQTQQNDQANTAPVDEESNYIKGLRAYDLENEDNQAMTELSSRLDGMQAKLDEQLHMRGQQQQEMDWYGDDNSTDELAGMYDTRTASANYNAAATGDSDKAPSSNAKNAMNYFTAKGYPKHIAAGIAANIEHESGFNANTKGDGGRAKGYAQWHPDRYDPLAKLYDLTTAQGNFDAIDHELHSTEKGALTALMGAKTASDAARLFDRRYERSAGLTTEQRMKTANSLYNN